ncbi:MAG: hypothetical protein PHV16_04215 [Candidatus Nanoarchaeia archaeon]|nr:hypothetical protein [Candidatus Nanoarchaeia archaeon]
MTIIDNFPLIEFIYSCLIIFPSLLIYIKTKKIYNFKKHTGVRYFSNAFLFFAISFSIRFIYFISRSYSEYSLSKIMLYNNYILIFFELFFLVPGFYFFMSLTYKNFGRYRKLAWRFGIVFLFLVSLVDYFTYTFLLMYIVSIGFFSMNSFISYRNYQKKQTKYGQIYSTAMVLLLISWILNFSTQYILDKIPFLRYYVYFVNVLAVLIMLFIVNKMLDNF